MSTPKELLQKSIARMDDPQWHEVIVDVGILLIAILVIHGIIASLNLVIKPHSVKVAALGLAELCLAAAASWALWRYHQHCEHPYSSIFPRPKRH